MGMYTELVIKASIKNDADVQAKEVLHHLFNGGECPKELPYHEFFKCERWGMIGRGNSYYHIPWTDSKYHEDYLFSRSDLKNYSSEIELFISWIMPYIDEIEGMCIGWEWYEEEEQPTLLFKK